MSQHGTTSPTLSPRHVAGPSGEPRDGPQTRESPSQSFTQPTNSAQTDSIQVSLTRDGQPELDDTTRAVVQTSEMLLEQFRRGSISRDEAIQGFRLSIGVEGTTQPDEPRQRAINLFVRQVDEEHSYLQQARAAGEHISAGSQLGRQDRHDAVSPAPSQPRLTDGELREYIDNFLGNRRRSSPRIDGSLSRAQAAGEGFDGPRDGILDDHESPSKRVKIHRSELPWTGLESSAPSINPSCAETQRLLLIFARDIPWVVSQLRLSTVVPPGFPVSEWTNICKGLPVNLDVVLSSLHFVHTPQTHTGHLGSVEVELGKSDPVKKVRTASEWSSAWHSASRAYRFIFEHREEELRQYGDWIEKQFSSRLPSSANKVILLDKAIRNFVGGGQRFLLTDRYQYDDLIDAIMSHDGIESVESNRNSGGRVVDANEEIGADLLTSANLVAGMDTDVIHARTKLERARNFVPRYKRYNDWGEASRSSVSTIDWTLDAAPLPSCPIEVLAHAPTTTTLTYRSELFSITTPINIPVFKSLLSDHPNQPFVESVIHMFEEGAWPFASIPTDYPLIHDLSDDRPLPSEKLDFLKEQRDIELSKGRYSNGFVTLCPGMYVMPLHVVPKDGGEALRLVTDHSSGKFSLNSMIDKTRMGSFPLDGMKIFGDELIKIHNRFPGERFVAWKSDVAEAYRLIPMHPRWQIKQVERIDGLYYVNRCNVFGGRASQALFIAFMSLVSWIASTKRQVEYFSTYSDDHFGVALESDVEFYPPYGEFLPSSQTRLLLLWDELGIPHKRKKQVSGNPLVIIGILVDVNLLRMSLSEEAVRDLLNEIERWCSKSGWAARQGLPMRDWQRFAGWMNWSFNVFPHLRPCLSNLYSKLSGKSDISKRIRINNAVRKDLQWAAGHLSSAAGVLLLENLHWDPLHADITLFTDACLEGMGFYAPELHAGFYAECLQSPHSLIFFQEALCVVSAMQWICDRATCPLRIVIFCDNTNVVDMFNSLAASPRLNPLVTHVIDLMLGSHHDLKVLYVSGVQNLVADALSRGNFNFARKVDSALSISSFEPPRLTLGLCD
ncbi:hypothetical protein CVT24_004651 [Panaeolus cyanescens]|uniref:Reverse transcriptase domain-containing protein n=1 Tax=Panaeolus cyanescens TaxID=181874 RepID=A0A409YSP7_9AGAR|nr:hypothetical protein CVT24_004651 [Panaeolus cyanescens]